MVIGVNRLKTAGGGKCLAIAIRNFPKIIAITPAPTFRGAQRKNARGSAHGSNANTGRCKLAQA